MNNVEHPNHYQLNVKLEVLDIINLIVSNKSLPKSDAFIVGNAVKYLLRCEKKNGIEDLEKCKYYLEMLKDKTYQSSYSEFEHLILKNIKDSIQDKDLALAFDSLYHLEIRNTLKHLTSHVIGKALSED